MFLENLSGILMKINESPDTRHEYEIWFDYTKETINLIHEGTMLAVPNFATKKDELHYSILEIVTIMPMHYGLGEDMTGFPGFLVEAARNAYSDWNQEKESTTHTTKIKCIAIPTNLEIKLNATSQDGDIQVDENMPMHGAEVRITNEEYTQRIINLGINKGDKNIITIGQLVRDHKVEVFLRIEELMKVHFGVFGFTGAGKSNLLSTLISKLLNDSSENIKIVIYDLMSEYTALLIDMLVNLPGSMIINLGEKTVPESLIQYFNDKNNSTLLQKAIDDYSRTTLLPKMLKESQEVFKKPIEELIKTNKIKIWRQSELTIGQFVKDISNEILKGNMGNSGEIIIKLLEDIKENYKDKKFSKDECENVLKEIENVKKEQTLNKTAINNIEELKKRLTEECNKTRVEIPKDLKITIPEIIEILNDSDKKSLIIVQSHDPNLLRHFSRMLGTFTYEERRQKGQINPLVSFVFDEADEFIPQNARDTYAESSDIAMTLARRGRKFGLGIGIATQRVIYLNTSIMAQPHTYFVSKLPRQSDRQRISEAFGVSDDIFRQTFKFKKGDWLLMSYDATGLEAIPIPIHVENADDRIKKFFGLFKERTSIN